MNFIMEKISDEAKAGIDWEPFRVRPNARYAFRPTRWAIDKSSDVFLVFIESHGRDPGPDLFGFSWKGNMFKVLAKKEFIAADSDQYDVKWVVPALALPQQLLDEKSAIEDAFKQALAVFENSGPWDVKSKVDVVIDK